MGFLMLAGLIGTLGYMGHYAKKETTAIIGDNTIKPTNNIAKDKQLISRNFKLICARGNAKLDKDNNPIYQNHYKPCVAYLQYQGFQESVIDYFKKIYLEKYDKKYKKEKEQIIDKHLNLEQYFYDNYDKKETKIFRHWHIGDTQTRCKKIMNNWLWSRMVTHYNVVKDGGSNVEVWSISAPPLILNQIEKIYAEVCSLENLI